MTSLRKIATPVACVAVISGAAILWWVHKQKAIERKKFGEAASISRVGAEQGDARAQFEFASMYYKGKGVRQDYGEAARWLRKAADQGYAKAQDALGVAYYYCQGVPQDYAEAVRWYRRAAEQGDAKAQLDLGSMYYEGKGVRQDYAEASRWYRRAADQGDAMAQYGLGYTYFQGKGVPQDYAEAIRWYRKAADLGNVMAQDNLGYMYFEGKGVPQDYVEAVRWFRKAADQGYAKAQYDLGYMYSQGKGLPPDHAEAARWFRKAAKQGDTKAQRALKTRLSTPSKVLITIEFLGTILLLVSSYRSAGGAFGPQQRTAIVKELLGLSYLVLVCMGLFQMGVAQTNAFRFTKNLLAGMVLAMLISVIWQQSAKSVLRISGMLFVAFNLYAIAQLRCKALCTGYPHVLFDQCVVNWNGNSLSRCRVARSQDIPRRTEPEWAGCSITDLRLRPLRLSSPTCFRAVSPRHGP